MLSEIIAAYMKPCDVEDWSGMFALACVNAPCCDAEEAWIHGLILDEWNRWIGRNLSGFSYFQLN